jgi:CheY-like chemotaxis protein
MTVPHRRVLLVDEDDQLREVVEEALVREGFDVVTAGDPRVVADLFATLGPFDVLLINHEIPGAKDTLFDEDFVAAQLVSEEELQRLKDLLDRLRAAGQAFRAVLISASLAPDEKQRAWAGLDRAIRKPFLVEDLLRRVREIAPPE